MTTIDESERRVKRGCLFVFVLLIVVLAVSIAESGFGWVTIALIGMLIFTTAILVVANLPQRKK